VSEEIWVPVAGGIYVGQQLSARFPVYTRGNAGEVFPEVHYPLSFSTGVRRAGQAGIRTLLSTGVVSSSEVANDDTAMIAVIAGYSYLNLSIVRLAATRTPGQTVADADFQYYGASDAPPHIPRPGDKNIARSVALLRFAMKTLRQGDDEQMDRDAQQVERWRLTLPNRKTATDAELVSAVRSYTGFFEELFEHHLSVSNKAGVPIGVLTQLCTKQLGEPNLVGQLLGGLGGVESAGPAVELWNLGRRVAGSSTLTALFDSGISGLHERIREAGGDDEQAFVTAFDSFLEHHGCRGPNEWESACDSWGTNPELPLGMVDRLRGADASHDPMENRRALGVARSDAQMRARKQLKPWNRRRFDQAIRAAGTLSQRREQAKTTVIRALHEVRLILLELDARIRIRSGSTTPKDIWFVVDDELDDYVAHPDRYQAVIAERRAMRELLATREPPFIVNGEMPPFDTWRLRTDTSVAAVTVGERLSGIPGCPGVARGRAVVVTDLSDLRDIGPGDVLVAPLTDPSWTPLFLAAEAVVVNVGALLSHAVIVSRELAIPCVVSVTDATQRIPNGALIEVDGTSGTITVLEMP
jgi:rifampicin phosphotransferase